MDFSFSWNWGEKYHNPWHPAGLKIGDILRKSNRKRVRNLEKKRMMVLQWGAVILAAFQMMPWIGGGLTGIAYFFNVLWYPFLVSALVLLYYDLRIRAESYDLEFRISQMEDRARPETLPGA